ncbi:MAG: hypothetical protein HY909_17525 [Deltaproteobacteria bacterium]|nr:hypothetical protein [Deltaproteobacteria bacterium]
MALIQARPSRGTLAFFGLVALGVLAARGWERHERTVERRDGPIAEDALRLTRCVVGPSAWSLLTGDNAPQVQELWAGRLAAQVRLLTTRPQAEGWFRRCAPLADRVARRLEDSPTAPEGSAGVARSLARLLSDRGATPERRLDVAEDESLARSLAALLVAVRAMSPGAEAHWDVYGRAATDLVAPVLPPLPRWRPLDPTWERPVLASADALSYRSARDGMVHRYEADGRSFRDVVVGPGVPWLEPPRDGAVRVETDDGPRMATATALLPFPDALRSGAGTFDGWSLEVSPSRRALLVQDGGTVTLYTGPSDGPFAWAPDRGARVGPAESVLAAVFAPEVTALGPGWRVSMLVPRLDDAALVQRLVRPDGTSLPEPVEPLRSPEVMTDAVDASAARISTCAAGDARYLIVLSEHALTTLRVEGRRIARASTTGVWPRDRAVGVQCDARRVLVGTDPTTARGGWYLTDFDERGVVPRLLEPLVPGPEARVQALTLHPDGVLATVSSRGSLRTFLQPRRGGAWTSQGMATLLEWPERFTLVLSRVSAQAEGARLTLLVEGVRNRTVWVPPAPGARPTPENPNANRPTARVESTAFAWLLGSSDGGRRFETL